MVSLHLSRIDHLDSMLERVKVRIGALIVEPKRRGREQDAIHTGDEPAPPRASGLLTPFAAQLALLATIPGVGERVASVIISEIGVDMSRFPTPAHLAAWTGLAPGNNESGGKRRRSGRRKGNTHLATILVEAAKGAAKTQTRIGAHFHRLRRRFGGGGKRRNNAVDPGWKKAAFATAHTLVKVIHRVLATGTPFQDLGYDYYTRTIKPEARARKLIAELEALSDKKIILMDGDPPGQPAAA